MNSIFYRRIQVEMSQTRNARGRFAAKSTRKSTRKSPRNVRGRFTRKANKPRNSRGRFAKK